MGRSAIAVVLALAACGRVHFDTGDSTSRVCGPAYLPAPDLPSKYRVSTVAANWFAAEADCESDGGHLVVVESAAEHAFVMSQLPGLDLWIGFSDHLEEGTFVSVTGNPITFENFGVGEPNDSAGEDCVEIFGSGGSWNDKECREQRVFVCECDLEPVPDPPTYCDTETEENCGECGASCAQTCVNQVCTNPDPS